MKGRLFDTSALLNLIVAGRSNDLRDFKNQAILDLTIYEFGNTLRRLADVQKKITYEEECDLLNIFLMISNMMRVLSVDGIEGDVKRICSQDGLNFYDSSFLAVAEHNSLTLVTDDERLLKIARKYVRARSSQTI